MVAVSCGVLALGSAVFLLIAGRTHCVACSDAPPSGHLCLFFCFLLLSLLPTVATHKKGARFQPQCEGEISPVGEIVKVGADASGLLVSPTQVR